MAYCKLVVLLLLSVPQVFAPLLHAHLGQEGAPAVLHLPGLERYYHAGDPRVDLSAPLPSWEGVVVRADDGVHRQLPLAPAFAAVPSPPLPSTGSPLPSPPQQAPPPLRLRSCLHDLLPRAPPA